MRRIGSIVIVVSLGGVLAQAQVDRPGLEGMWSDPPATAEGLACFAFCTDAGLEYLNALLDDPANDQRDYPELRDEARRQELLQYIQPRLTDAGLAASRAADPADDRGFLYCEPWGLARQVFAPHQLQLTFYDDRIEMRYGEWDARRTAYLDDRESPAGTSRLGFSRARHEGDTLVIESAGISANQTFWGEHGDQLRIVERYTRSRDGTQLFLTAAFEDPWSIRDTLELKKVWTWSPGQEIFPYENCERPQAFRRRETEP